MVQTYLGHGRTAWDIAAPYVNIYRRHIMIASLPVKLKSAQLHRQTGGQCLGQIMNP